MIHQLQNELNESSIYIKSLMGKHINEEHESVAVILGSGLGHFAETLNNPLIINYKNIPHFKHSTVEGHAGNLVIGKWNKKNIFCMQGRIHFYEGHSINEVIYPIRTLKQLGVSKIILTNAAGAINQNFKVGDFVLINDHINLTGQNPLIGPNFDFLGPRFPDMSEGYDQKLIELAQKALLKIKRRSLTGVYAGLSGPCYETPAEIRMLRTLGADMVGMSTVNEVIAARHMGISCLAISCMTNMAAGILKQKLSHDEVKEIADQNKNDFISLIHEVLSLI
jgi:purine-nucleoside phosphorylase